MLIKTVSMARPMMRRMISQRPQSAAQITAAHLLCSDVLVIAEDDVGLYAAQRKDVRHRLVAHRICQAP